MSALRTAAAGLPLAGVRVLDLSRLLPGAYATMLLADLGADVVKVEQPGAGDPLRAFPPTEGAARSGAHEVLNRGKRSITLDLRADGGAELFAELAAGADILVESFRPGVLDRLGVGYAGLRHRNPGLIHVAISGFGATGPYRNRAGHDIDYLAYSGALSLTGCAGRPQPPGLQIADIGGGAFPAVVAALAALRVRDATGQGQFCDVSMTDGVFSWLVLHLGGSLAGALPPRPGDGLLGGGYACYRVYECADGRFVAVGALEPKFFMTLVRLLGVPDVASWQYDSDRQAELCDLLQDRFRARGRDEWMRHFADVDACVAPVLELSEALADPHLQFRQMVPSSGRLPVPGVVPRLGTTPGRASDRAPELGADTDSVLAALGKSAAEIAALREAGTV